jgi:phosphate starvation-inducible PhoH-like protein
VSAEYVTKHIDLENRVAALLVGEHDSHLRALEQLLDCDISLRGNQLTLEGTSTEVERGEALVEELSPLKSGKASIRRRSSWLQQAQSRVTGPRPQQDRQRRHPGA